MFEQVKSPSEMCKIIFSAWTFWTGLKAALHGSTFRRHINLSVECGSPPCASLPIAPEMGILLRGGVGVALHGRCGLKPRGERAHVLDYQLQKKKKHPTPACSLTWIWLDVVYNSIPFAELTFQYKKLLAGELAIGRSVPLCRSGHPRWALKLWCLPIKH